MKLLVKNKEVLINNVDKYLYLQKYLDENLVEIIDNSDGIDFKHDERSCAILTDTAVLYDEDLNFVRNVFFESKRHWNSSRNTLISQGIFVKSLIQKDTNFIDGSIIFLKNEYDSKKYSDYNKKMVIPLLVSLGGEIYCEKKIKTFDSFYELAIVKMKLNKKNSANSVFWFDFATKTIYINLNSHFVEPAMILMYILKNDFDNINDYSIINIVDKVENEANVSFFEKKGFKFLDEKISSNDFRRPFTFEKNEINNNVRNQSLYRTLVLKKYVQSKAEIQCAICGIKNENILECAHLLEVRDIKKLDIDLNEKITIANNENNGIFMCRNHHRLFDDGEIYFDFDMKTFVNNVENFEESYYNVDIKSVEENNKKILIFETIHFLKMRYAK